MKIMKHLKTLWISLGLSCLGCMISHAEPAAFTTSTDAEPIVLENDIVWGRQIGTAANDVLLSVNVDSQDNVYVIGSTEGSLAGENHGKKDAFFVKYNSTGDELYRRQIGTAEDDEGLYIICDPHDNVVVTGFTSGQLGDQHFGGSDAFVAKYSPEGELLWLTQYGSDQDDQGYTIELDAEGNIVICGGTNGVMGEKNLGKQDSVVTKLSADGKVLWNTQFGTPELEYGRGLCIDSKGTILAVSSFYMTNISSIVAISPDGKILKQKDFADIKLFDVFTNEDDEIYVSGHNKGTSMFERLDGDFEPMWVKTFHHGQWSGEKEIRPFRNNLYVTSGCMNWPKCFGFVRIYDAFDNLKYWNKIRKSTDFESEDSTCGNFLAVDSNGAIYHVGGTDEDFYAPNAGDKDGFLCKIEF